MRLTFELPAGPSFSSCECRGPGSRSCPAASRFLKLSVKVDGRA